LDAFPYLEHFESIAGSEPLLPPPPRPQTDDYLSAKAPLRDCIAEPSERDTQGCLEMNLQNNPYYPFAKREEYKYIQSQIKKKDMKTYSDNVLKEENTALRYPSFTNGDRIQMLVASMPDDEAIREWELHTFDNMR